VLQQPAFYLTGYITGLYHRAVPHVPPRCAMGWIRGWPGADAGGAMAARRDEIRL